MKGIKSVAARFWTHDSKSGDLAVAFLRMILAKMKEGGLGGADLEQFTAEFEKLYGDKAERIKFDGQDVGEKRKNEGTANGRESAKRSSPNPPLVRHSQASTTTTTTTTATSSSSTTTTTTTTTAAPSSGGASNRFAPQGTNSFALPHSGSLGQR